MHYSSIDNMQRCVRKHVLTDATLAGRSLKILDVGGANVNGSYRDAMQGLDFSYHAVDIDAGKGVDTVLSPTGPFPFADESFDVVLSGQTFEHTEFFWETFKEMVRVCRRDGVVIVIAPSSGAVHRYPVDCYRFNPDSYVALAKLAPIELVDSWVDPRGPWHDLVGVFRKQPAGPAYVAPVVEIEELDEALQNTYPINDDPSVEARAGTDLYLEYLPRVHETLQPRSYLEIGVWSGLSLRIASCRAVGVDPAPRLLEPLKPNHEMALMTSDDYFLEEGLSEQITPLDLSYIDGMHMIENVLMDFINIENICHPNSVIMIDDVYPNHVLQARRQRVTQHWMGDVWKIIPILQKYRPDLLLVPVNTEPSGTLLVVGLNPTERILWERFDIILEEAVDVMSDPTPDILERHGALEPRDPLLEYIVTFVRQSRERNDWALDTGHLRNMIAGASPRQIAPQ